MTNGVGDKVAPASGFGLSRASREFRRAERSAALVRRDKTCTAKNLLSYECGGESQNSRLSAAFGVFSSHRHSFNHVLIPIVKQQLCIWSGSEIHKPPWQFGKRGLTLPDPGLKVLSAGRTG